MKSQQKCCALAFAVSVLLLLSFSSAKPAHAQSQTIPVASLLNPDGTINTTTGVNGALDLRGWNVTLDSKRGPVLSPQQQPLDAPQAVLPDKWWALNHKGLNGTVFALAVIGSKVYVGGDFVATADSQVTGLNGIAAFDVNTGVWSALSGSGLLVWNLNNNSQCTASAGTAHAFAVSGTTLYVGGVFGKNGTTCTNTSDNIIAYQTNSNTFASFGDGLNGEVDALAVSSGFLYIGGIFTANSDGTATNLNHIALYSFSNRVLIALAHHGLNDAVFALLLDPGVCLCGDVVYAGGNFTASGDGQVTNLNGIAELQGSNGWVALPNHGLNDNVTALAFNGSDLYVGGSFTQSADGAVTNLNRIARFDGTNWNALAHNGLNGHVSTIQVFSPCQNCLNVVYVGGLFTQTADGQVTNLNHIAELSIVFRLGLVWSALPNRGLNDTVEALAQAGDDLYAGGVFAQTQDGAVKNLNRIARFAPTFHLFLPLVIK